MGRSRWACSTDVRTCPFTEAYAPSTKRSASPAQWSSDMPPIVHPVRAAAPVGGARRGGCWFQRLCRRWAVAPSSNRRRLLALVTATLAVAGLVVSAPWRAGAATTYGNDVSWPQCSVAEGGGGLPMPPATAGFVVIG